MVHDLMQIKLKLIKCTPKDCVKKVLFLDILVNLGVQIRKGDQSEFR